MGDVGKISILRKIATLLDRYIGLHDSTRGDFGKTMPDELLVMEKTVRSLVDEKFALYHLFAKENEIGDMVSALVWARSFLHDTYPTNTRSTEVTGLLDKMERASKQDNKAKAAFHEETRDNLTKLLE
jgi:hypothetical protein